MRDRVAARLEQLRRDYEAGQNQLRHLAQEEAALRETLLRISGAIQVLAELEADDEADRGAPRTEQRAGPDAPNGATPASVLSVP